MKFRLRIFVGSTLVGSLRRLWRPGGRITKVRRERHWRRHERRMARKSRLQRDIVRQGFDFRWSRQHSNAAAEITGTSTAGEQLFRLIGRLPFVAQSLGLVKDVHFVLVSHRILLRQKFVLSAFHLRQCLPSLPDHFSQVFEGNRRIVGVNVACIIIIGTSSYSISTF